MNINAFMYLQFLMPDINNVFLPLWNMNCKVKRFIGNGFRCEVRKSSVKSNEKKKLEVSNFFKSRVIFSYKN